ncbi:MAG TPA: hypothetical protein VML75_11735 [Kofleriaceae bacterium]|nr:hypothetical protein [Kofleriaceae bacterium]
MAPADGTAPAGGAQGGGAQEGGDEYADPEGGGYDDGSGDYAGGDYAAGGGGGGGGSFCDRMCRMRVECAGSTYDDCLEGCNITASDLPPEAADELDCEQMRAEAKADRDAAENAARRGGSGGGNGSQCRARGIDDCPAMTMCCRRLGRCESPGVCNMPTR